MIRRFCSLTIFPFVFGGSIAAALLLMNAGIDPLYAAILSVGPAALIVILAEHVIPYGKSWNRPRGDVGTDTAHMTLSQVVLPEVSRLLAIGLLTGGSVWLSTKLGMNLWPKSIPLLLQFLLASIVAEFGSYWTHRLSHQVNFLWRFHSIHHSSPRLYWLNAGRFHPIDVLVTLPVSIFPLILLGAPAQVLTLVSVFTAVHGMFQHANIDVRLGPLNWIFSMAELHRWHHSRKVRDANHNYGANLILWDILFRTRFLPKDRKAPMKIGIASMPNFPKGYFAQLLVPLRWKSTQTSSRKKNSLAAPPVPPTSEAAHARTLPS